MALVGHARPYFSRNGAESLDLWENVFQKLCVTGLTLSGTGKTYASAFAMANTTKTAVEIEWILDEPVREDIYEYIVSA